MVKERLLLIGTHSTTGAYYSMSNELEKIVRENCGTDNLQFVYKGMVKYNDINLNTAISNAIERKFINLLHEFEDASVEYSLHLLKHTVISTVAIMMPDMQLPIPVYEKLLIAFNIEELTDMIDDVESIYQRFIDVASVIPQAHIKEIVNWTNVFNNVGKLVAQIIINMK